MSPVCGIFFVNLDFFLHEVFLLVYLSTWGLLSPSGSSLHPYVRRGKIHRFGFTRLVNNLFLFLVKKINLEGEKRTLYVHETEATDTDNIRKIFDDVKVTSIFPAFSANIFLPKKTL